MAKYIDLSSVVDVEPEVCEVLPLIEDDDLQYEFWQRLDEGFFKLRDAKDAHPQARELAAPLHEEFIKRGLINEN